MNQVMTFLAGIRWQDIVDIVLNSYILFRFYVLFRGTNAFRVLIGIVLLWFFQKIAEFLGLIVTSWAIQGITAAAAIIIIVVFRNEIGSVLQAKNFKAILWGFPNKTKSTPIDNLLESINELSHKQMGYLIVLPGKDDISEIVHSGLAWQGTISKEMIVSIFWPGNPVHDGAVIIQGDQIVEAEVILPLSRQKNLPSNYGTRHRAALGLAEKSDALVIVGSEERGKITVATKSQLIQIGHMDELADFLQRHIGVESDAPEYQKKEKLKIAVASFVSLLFIIGIWFSFSRGFKSLITLEVPIQYINQTSEREIIETSAVSVHLKLIGSGALIKSIRPEQAAVRLDLSQALNGKNTYTISETDVTLPPGISLKNIEPNIVEVTLDKLTYKILPIQVDWTGKLDPGLILEKVVLTPENVKVFGGSHVLKDIFTLYTEEVSLKSIKESGSVSLNLELVSRSLKVAPGIQSRVIASFVVKKREGENKFVPGFNRK